MKAKLIGIVGYDGVTALDIAGPAEAFASAVIGKSDGNAAPQCGYKIVIIAATAKHFTSESGVVLKPHTTFQNAPALDTLIIPGGAVLRRAEGNAKMSAWIKERAEHIRRIASVCTGIYALAPTGLIDKRRVTTHWRHARDLARRFPKLKVDPDALFINDGKFYSSAGITAGIDLSLALIEEDYGAGVSLSVARELVVYLKRSGGQEQFSEPLEFQTRSRDRIAELAAWMTGHLRQDLSVEALAEKACLCPRHFSRRFKDVFDSTPAAFVEDLRLGEARKRLTKPGQTISSVAASVGFKSTDAFRRAFERCFGIKPSSYRRHFTA